MFQLARSFLDETHRSKKPTVASSESVLEQRLDSRWAYMSKSKRYVKLGMGTAAIVGVVFVCASMWIHSDAGHAYISKRIQSYATEGMAGSLEIGSLYEIDFLQGLTGVRVLAGDVRFRAPDGRETIHVGDADATLDLAAFL